MWLPNGSPEEKLGAMLVFKDVYDKDAEKQANAALSL